MDIHIATINHQGLARSRTSLPKIDDGPLSDATTEPDDDETLDQTSFGDVIKHILATTSNNVTQESSKAALRRQKREKDPEATESESDDQAGTFRALQISGLSVHTVSLPNVEVCHRYLYEGHGSFMFS